VRRMFRVLIGFLIACIAAALTTLLFVITPGELIGWLSLDDGGERFQRFGLLWLAASTQSVIFSALFALAAVILAEWLGKRDWIFYANTGIIIAVLGFLAQWMSEPTGQNWSVVNSSYPLVAFLATGFVGGVVYWMWAGRHAGGMAAAEPKLLLNSTKPRYRPKRR
jgi:MFS family permease